LILTIDTFVWLEVIRGTPAGDTGRRAMQEADEVLTPGIVLAEVAGACHRTGLSDNHIARALSAIREASMIVPIDDRVAISATHALDELRSYAKLRGLDRPGIVDALILATAREREAHVLTGDPHFQDLPETVWVA